MTFMMDSLVLKWLCLVITVLLSSVEAQTTFTTQPMSVRQAEGLEAVIECRYPGDEITHVLFLNDRNVDAQTPSEDFPAMFTISAMPVNTNIIAQCEATVRMNGGAVFVLSENATLMFFAVGSIDSTNSMDSISLSWTDRNFTTTIFYCVDVVQTFGSTELISSECDLNVTQYSLPSPGHGPCDRFNFTVTPTDGEMNGTSSEPVTGFFTQAIGMGGNTSVSEGQNMDEKDISLTGMVPDCFSPTTYQVESDILDTPLSGLLSSSLPLSFSLTTDMRTNVTVTLTDDNGVDLLFENIATSTFDIQDLTVSVCPQPNCVSVSVRYALGSTSPGALICVVPVLGDGSLNISRTILVPIDMSEDVSIMNVPAGRHRVFAFDLESNGTPRIPLAVAADSEIIEVTSDGGITTSPPTDGTSPTIEATKLPNGVVSVTCSDVTFNCLALVQSASNPDQLSIGLINSAGDRTVTLSPGASGEVSLVVLTWMMGETFLNGQISFVSQFQAPPTTPPTPTDSTTTQSPGVTDPVQSFPIGAIIGIIIVVLIVVLVIIVIVVVILVLVLKNRQKNKVKMMSDDYNVLNSGNGSSSTTGTTADVDLGVPLDPFYDVVQPDKSNPPPRYEDTTEVPLNNEAPPIPPPMITADNDAPPLPPAYVPDDVEMNTIDQSATKEMSEEQIGREVQYALVEPTPQPQGLPDQPTDETKVIYTEVDKFKLAPVPEGGATPSPTLSTSAPPPTADSLLSVIHPLAGRWEDLGKALGVDEDKIDDFFTNNENDQLRLHDLVQYYFINVHYQHTWEEIVRVLREIGETEIADKIVREKTLGGCDELPQYSSVV